MGEPLAVLSIFFALFLSFAIPCAALAIGIVLLRSVVPKKRPSFKSALRDVFLLTCALSVVLFFSFTSIKSALTPKVPAPETVSIETFHMADYYQSHSALKFVLDKLFPAGTPKQQIDDILVLREGASTDAADVITDELKKKDTAIAIYRLSVSKWVCFPMGGSPGVRIRAEYDASLKLIAWKISGF